MENKTYKISNDGDNVKVMVNNIAGHEFVKNDGTGGRYSGIRLAIEDTVMESADKVRDIHADTYDEDVFNIGYNNFGNKAYKSTNDVLKMNAETRYWDDAGKKELAVLTKLIKLQNQGVRKDATMKFKHIRAAAGRLADISDIEIGAAKIARQEKLRSEQQIEPVKAKPVNNELMRGVIAAEICLGGKDDHKCWENQKSSGHSAAFEKYYQERLVFNKSNYKGNDKVAEHWALEEAKDTFAFLHNQIATGKVTEQEINW